MIKILETSELKSVVGGAAADEYLLFPVIAMTLVNAGSPELIGDVVRSIVQG